MMPECCRTYSRISFGARGETFTEISFRDITQAYGSFMRNMRKSSKMILRHKFRPEQSDNFLPEVLLGLAASLYMMYKNMRGSALSEDFRNANS